MDLQIEGITPCMRCWPQEPDWDGWLRLELFAENHAGAKDGSPYELTFFQDVLRRVPVLDPQHIKIQPEIKTRHGFRYPDFVLDIPGHQPIALEIDGQAKSANPRPDEREQSLRRDAALEEAGFRVQHFTNRQVATDPGWCLLQVERVVADVQRIPPRTRSAPVLQPEGSSEKAMPKSWIGWSIAAAFVVVAAITAIMLLGSDPDDSDLAGPCDSSHPVKGNVSQYGERIYHEPGWMYYERTNAEECFATAEDAESAGYRASEVK